MINDSKMRGDLVVLEIRTVIGRGSGGSGSADSCDL